MDPEDDTYGSAPEPQAAPTGEPQEPAAPQARVIDEAERRLAARLVERIECDKRKHKPIYDRMRRDMRIARRGADEKWPKDHYVANITGRHINQSTASLYAKNPKAVAKRRPRMEFRVWDESPETLMAAYQIAQSFDPRMAPMGLDGRPVLPPAIQQAVDLVADAQAGLLQREQFAKIGRTLEILFDYYMQEQSPVDFKTSMKKVVRRAKTCGVGFVEVGFQRRDPATDGDVTGEIADVRTQVRHIGVLQSRIAEQPSSDTTIADARELETATAALQSQPDVMFREGLVFDFPFSTRVIPDEMCTDVVGWVGARWLTIEYLFTRSQVRGLFNVDVGPDAKTHSSSGRDGLQPDLDFGDDARVQDEDLVCVWKHFDRQAGVVYFLVDGYKGLLRPPGPPDIYVESFFPVYALTFNDVEDEECCWPPSDVELMQHMQRDFNSARQGRREHRRAARPRFASQRGALGDEDKIALVNAEPFSVTEVNMLSERQNINEVLQAISVPGVDPNLYETATLFDDIQVTVGSSEAQFGGTSQATATESAIAESSGIKSTDSNVDDLDAFLTRLARAAGGILLKEMTVEAVQEIVGPGAVWPSLTIEQVAAEIYLEVKAGSSGKPNQAADIRNWQQILPFLLQMPNMNAEWLLRETLTRLDDKMDVTDAIMAGLPAIVAQNAMAQPSPEDPAADPAAQGPEGGNPQARAPEQQEGSEAAFGSNQV